MDFSCLTSQCLSSPPPFQLFRVPQQNGSSVGNILLLLHLPLPGERLGNGIPQSSFWKCCHGCDQDPSWHSNGLICFSACPAATSQSPRKGRASIAECQTDLLSKKEKRSSVSHHLDGIAEDEQKKKMRSRRELSEQKYKTAFYLQGV